MIWVLRQALILVTYLVIIIFVMRRKGSNLESKMLCFFKINPPMPSDYGIDHFKEVVEPGNFPECFNRGRMIK